MKEFLADGFAFLARSGVNETASESEAAPTNLSEYLPRFLMNLLGLDSGLPPLIVIRFIAKRSQSIKDDCHQIRRIGETMYRKVALFVLALDSHIVQS